jgi:hypothetical protein
MSSVGIRKEDPNLVHGDEEKGLAGLLLEPDSPKIQDGAPNQGAAANGINYIIKPMAHINETKDLLHKLGTVTIVRKQMVFSDVGFEKRFVNSLETKLRSRMLIFGLVACIYSIYNMFFVCIVSILCFISLVQLFRTGQDGKTHAARIPLGYSSEQTVQRRMHHHSADRRRDYARVMEEEHVPAQLGANHPVSDDPDSCRRASLCERVARVFPDSRGRFGFGRVPGSFSGCDRPASRRQCDSAFNGMCPVSRSCCGNAFQEDHLDMYNHFPGFRHHCDLLQTSAHSVRYRRKTDSGHDGFSP